MQNQTTQLIKIPLVNYAINSIQKYQKKTKTNEIYSANSPDIKTYSDKLHV